MGRTCAKCGKPYFLHPALKPYICRECGKTITEQEYSKIRAAKNPRLREGTPPALEAPFKDALGQARRIVVIKDAVFSADGIGKHIETYSRVAEKFGYVYKSETHFPDSIGISLSIIFEKIIQTANETHFINCTHCTSRYDANQYFKCPQCGAPTT